MERCGKALCPFRHQLCKITLVQRNLLHSVTNPNAPKCSRKPLILNNDYQLVISGISGRFPQSDNMEELRNNLLGKQDMVEQQSKFASGDIPNRFGFIKNIDKFDAQFFGIRPSLANYMDPQSRKLLEVTFESILDAGINPGKLKGSSIGVFVGALNDETNAFWVCKSQTNAMEGYGALCANYSLANRVSFAFDFKGPSYMFSSGCSAGLVGIEAAVLAIKAGHCDAAIVAACSSFLSPCSTMDLTNQVGALSPDGKCKSFDASGDGFVRSEAISAILIQKRDDAKRMYGIIRSVQSSSDGFKKAGFGVSSAVEQEYLFTKMYSKSGIDPGKVKYLEGHATGTLIGDWQEIQAVSKVFCKAPSRTEPLLVGSVKSNMGHTESAAGLCGIAKVIIGIQEGQIPPNLHFNKPREEFKHLFGSSSNAMQVVTEAVPFTGGLIGVSSFGVGGSNAHLVIEAGVQNQNQNLMEHKSEIQDGTSAAYTDSNSSKIPIILPFSGRTEEAVTEALKKASEKFRVENPEFCGLIHNIFKTGVKGHLFRGFKTYNAGTDNKKVHVNELPFKATDGRPVCVVFSGLGSQWNEMGLDLQKLDVFKESLRKSNQALLNVGVDLMEMLQPGNPKLYADMEIANFAIAAIQIALYDTLFSLKIYPDIFIGYSVGEVLCGYADGSFTAEEALFFSGSEGRAANDLRNSPATPGYVGAMAYVEINWEELASKLPANVYIAGKNSANITTISGESTAITSFLQQLKHDGVLVGKINSCGVPVHSPITDTQRNRDTFSGYISKFFSIKTKRLRSARWISTSVPPEEWGSESEKYNSVEYHCNNIRFPVLFHQAVQQIPQNATVIEVGPTGQFVHILKGSLSSRNFVTALMTAKPKPKKSGVKNTKFEPVLNFLTSIGKIYNSGVNVDFSRLYPPVSFPVAASTPGLSSLVKWNHDDSWTVPLVSNIFKDNSQGMTFTIDLSSPNYQLLKGYKVDGNNIFPAAAYVWLAWKGLAYHLGLDMNELPIVLENVEFKRATALSETKPVEFCFTMSHSSGAFEITEEDSVVASGNIRKLEGKEDLNFILNSYGSSLSETFSKSKSEEIVLDAADVYKEIRLRGQDVSVELQGIYQIKTKERCAEIKWNNNWIAFLDSVFQLTCTCVDIPTNRHSMVPVRLQKIKIDPSAIHAHVKERQKQRLETTNSEIPILIPIKVNKLAKAVSLPGLELHKLTTSIVPRKRQDESLVAQEYKFSAYFDDVANVMSSGFEFGVSSPSNDVKKSSFERLKNIQVSGILDLIVENVRANIKILDVFASFENSLSGVIHKSLVSKPQAKVNITIVSTLEEMEKLDDGARTLGSHQIVESSELEKFQLDSTEDAVFLDNNKSTLFDLKKISASMKENSFLVLHSVIQATNTNNDASMSPHQSENQAQSKFEIEIPNMVKISEKCTVNLENQEPSTFKMVAKLASYHNVDASVNQPRLNVWASHFENAAKRGSHKIVVGIVRYETKTASSSLVENGAIKSLAIDSDSFDWLPKLQELIVDAGRDTKFSSRSRIFLTSQSDPANGIIGFFNCLKKESKGANLRCIFDPEKTLELNFQSPDQSLSDIIQKDLVMNVVKGGKLGSYRHFPLANDISLPHKYAEHAYVNTLIPGDITSLRWIESPLKYYFKDDKSQKLCKVHYAGLNFKDILLSSGKLLTNFDVMDPVPVSTRFGFEFSGIDGEGRRVMGILDENAMATSVLAPSHVTWTIPDHWTLEEAATVPVVYLTAYYALYDRAQIQPGQSILIHSGTSGTGQAAIHLAMAAKCEIYTTVENEEKRDFIKATFPTLPDENIFSSKDYEFQMGVLERTKGRGVDVVLNSISGDTLVASVGCLTKKGKFLDVGMTDMTENTELDMRCLLKKIDFLAVDARDVQELSEAEMAHPTLLKLQRGVENGDVKPLKSKVFNTDEVEDAFTFMADGKHVEKIVIKMRDEESNPNTQYPQSSVSISAKEQKQSKSPSPSQVLAIPQTYFHSDKTYILTGALGGLGFETAIWLVQRGAKKIILTSRSGIITGYHKLWIKYLTDTKGAQVRTLQIDLSNFETARNFFEKLSKDKEKVGGIFNSYLVLNDALIEDQTVEMFQKVASPKVNLTKNLDQLSREFCPELDYFVVYSSLACGNGNAGQSNYGMANSVMERICEKRQVDGLHGLAIQWGMIGEVGYLREMMSNMGVASYQGTVPQNIHSCMEVLDHALNQNCPVVASAVLDENFLTTGNKSVISQKLSTAFGIKDFSSINPNTRLYDLGMDSLIGIEIKQILERDYDLSLTPAEIRSLCFAELLAVEAGTYVKRPPQKL